jgi:voltage-gated potassium channel
MIYFLCVFLGATSVLYLEAEVDGSNIRSARDAIWWAMVTVTTVGYGDFTPVTNEGRLLAVTLMSAGIGLFGVFSVQCTQYLLKRWQDDEDDKLGEIQTELSRVKAELNSVKYTLTSLTELLSTRYERPQDRQSSREEMTATHLPTVQEGDHQEDG